MSNRIRDSFKGSSITLFTDEGGDTNNNIDANQPLDSSHKHDVECVYYYCRFTCDHYAITEPT